MTRVRLTGARRLIPGPCRTRRSLRVMPGVRVQQPPDHALVLRVVLARLVLEKLDAALAQRDRHLDAFVPEYEILGTRQEVRNDLEVAEGFVGVPNFLAHRSV